MQGLTHKRKTQRRIDVTITCLQEMLEGETKNIRKSVNAYEIKNECKGRHKRKKQCRNNLRF